MATLPTSSLSAETRKRSKAQLPPGFILDPFGDKSPSVPTLPPGFVLDQPGPITPHAKKLLSDDEIAKLGVSSSSSASSGMLLSDDEIAKLGVAGDPRNGASPAGAGESWSDEEIDRLTAKTPTARGPSSRTASDDATESWSDDDIDRMKAAAAKLPDGFVLDDSPSVAGGFLRSIGQGATADFGDEIVGLVSGDDAKKSYRQKSKSSRKSIRIST